MYIPLIRKFVLLAVKVAQKKQFLISCADFRRRSASVRLTEL